MWLLAKPFNPTREIVFLFFGNGSLDSPESLAKGYLDGENALFREGRIAIEVRNYDRGF